MNLANHGVARDAAERLCNLARALAFTPHRFQFFNAIIGPRHVRLPHVQKRNAPDTSALLALM